LLYSVIRLPYLPPSVLVAAVEFHSLVITRQW